MKLIRLDLSKAAPLTSRGINALAGPLRRAAAAVRNRTGAGSEYLGWVDLPARVPPAELKRIEALAAKIHRRADAFVAIGIGGSYLGARAVIEALNGPFSPLTGRPPVFFAGNNLSGRYHRQLLGILQAKKSVYVNVISKSGTTTEPAVAFRLIRNLLVRKYGAGADARISATTDSRQGALRSMADKNGWETFVIPDNVGGRFSVLTPVGLLPLAVAGVDLRALLAGARAMQRHCDTAPVARNLALQYAAARYLLHTRHRKAIELLVNYDPGLHSLAEWWKQLYGESEGKQGKGLFPAAVDFTTDLHSLGQWVQDGVRTLFETVITVGKTGETLAVPRWRDDADGLNYLAGKTTEYVNEQARRGTLEAHLEGGVPNLLITLPELNAFYLGQLLYFFERACAVSGYLLKVNPFDQPGVEAYKKNMFRLLGKK